MGASWSSRAAGRSSTAQRPALPSTATTVTQCSAWAAVVGSVARPRRRPSGACSGQRVGGDGDSRRDDHHVEHPPCRSSERLIVPIPRNGVAPPRPARRPPVGPRHVEAFIGRVTPRKVISPFSTLKHFSRCVDLLQFEGVSRISRRRSSRCPSSSPVSWLSSSGSSRSRPRSRRFLAPSASSTFAARPAGF